MVFILITSLLELVLAGYELFPQGLKVEWSFPCQYTVRFDYHVPASVYNYWGWVGFGIKQCFDQDLTMAHSDLWTLQFNTHQIHDRMGDCDCFPKQDYKRNGTDDLFLQDGYVLLQDQTRVYTILRLLNTGDYRDIPLEKGKDFIFMWAMGQLYQNKPKPHLPWMRGREYSTFTEDYADDGSDDIYGDGGGCPAPYEDLSDPQLQEVCSDLVESLQVQSDEIN